MGNLMNIPELRFPEFKGEWKVKKFSVLTERISNPVKVELDKMYQQIGIRSHDKGIFHKEFVDGKT
jgi:type I restriction enzyme S subunit